jgi:acetoin utilization deacetylase AcuC-like enzyme
MKKTGFVFDERYLLHNTGDWHPESAERLRVIVDGLKESGLMDQLIRIEPEPANQRWIESVHHVNYIMRFSDACAMGMQEIDHNENVICRESYDAALLAAGGVITALDWMMKGDVETAFCAVRPPGHHAEADKAMGFCYFNNVAIGARYLQRQWNVERVGIIDFDVHHGNGTQHIFESDPTVYYYSIHEHPSFAYPGTGRDFDKGIGEGEGYTLNSLILPGRGDHDYRRKLTEDLIPEFKRFQPEVILVSAGFDAHTSDMMSGVNLSTDGYDFISELIMNLANTLTGGRVVSVLEGGYNLQILPLLVENHIKHLAGIRGV